MNINTIKQKTYNLENLILDEKNRRSIVKNMVREYNQLEEEIKEDAEELKLLVKAADVLGSISDTNTKQTLDFITNIINKALGTLFTEDARKISINKIMYSNIYPHYVVELETSEGFKRTFKQSGTGLAQVISFLFTICLIDAREGRKIFVMDELLNGLHPDAKKVVKNLIEVLSKEFQFIIVEYGLDIGKEYEVVKTKDTSKLQEFEGGEYYLGSLV